VIDDHELWLRRRLRIRLDLRSIRLLLVGVLKALAGLRLLRDCLRSDEPVPPVIVASCRPLPSTVPPSIRSRFCDIAPTTS